MMHELRQDGRPCPRHAPSIPPHEPTLLRASTSPVASPTKRKNLKKLSVSTAAAQKLGPSIDISDVAATRAPPLSAGMSRRMPLRLPALNIGLTRRPSLPVLTGKKQPGTPIDRTFSMVRELQPISSEHEKEMNNVPAYTSGPICVLPPNLWLYSEPTAKEIKEFDVVINVAREVRNPLLQESPETTQGPLKPTTGHQVPAGASDSKDKGQASLQVPGTSPDLCLHQGEALACKMYEGVEYVHMPWEHNQALMSDLPTLMAFMDRRIQLQNKRVLVHCQQGVSRSASLVIAYIMKHEALDVNEAYTYVKRKSSHVGPNMSLIYQLCEWGKTLQKSKSTALQRRSFDAGGAKTAPSDGAFAGSHKEQRKRATSTVERTPMVRTRSEQHVSTTDALQRISLHDTKSNTAPIFKLT